MTFLVIVRDINLVFIQYSINLYLQVFAREHSCFFYPFNEKLMKSFIFFWFELIRFRFCKGSSNKSYRSNGSYGLLCI